MRAQVRAAIRRRRQSFSHPGDALARRLIAGSGGPEKQFGPSDGRALLAPPVLHVS